MLINSESEGETNDERQVLALAAAYREMLRIVAAGEFRLDRATINSLNLLVARREALDSGQFHGGGGTVSLGGGDYYRATSNEGDGGQALRLEFLLATQYLQEQSTIHSSERWLTSVSAPSTNSSSTATSALRG